MPREKKTLLSKFEKRRLTFLRHIHGADKICFQERLNDFV